MSFQLIPLLVLFFLTWSNQHLCAVPSQNPDPGMPRRPKYATGRPSLVSLNSDSVQDPNVHWISVPVAAIFCYLSCIHGSFERQNASVANANTSHTMTRFSPTPLLDRPRTAHKFRVSRKSCLQYIVPITSERAMMTSPIGPSATWRRFHSEIHDTSIPSDQKNRSDSARAENGMHRSQFAWAYRRAAMRWHGGQWTCTPIKKIYKYFLNTTEMRLGECWAP